MTETTCFNLTPCPLQSQHMLPLPQDTLAICLHACAADSQHGTAAPPSRLLFPSQDLLTQCLADYLQQSCEAWQQISCARERAQTSGAGWLTWSWIEFSNLSGSAAGWSSHIPELSGVKGGFLKGFCTHSSSPPDEAPGGRSIPAYFDFVKNDIC